MGVRIQQYTGQKFITTMPETGNQNPHHTLFAGSLFSLATLTGWGRPQPVSVASENRLPANSVWCGFWLPVSGMVVMNFCPVYC